MADPVARHRHGLGLWLWRDWQDHRPVGLALIVGASDVMTPKATLDAILPSFLYFAAWMVLCGFAFLFLGFETGRQSLTEIDAELGNTPRHKARP